MSSAATTLSSIHAATARIEQGALIVSIHDVAPASRQIAERIASELSRRGITAFSLLVVPNYHQTGSITADRELGIWLRALEGRGDEIVIHGYYHQRPRHEHESVSAKLITRFYTKDEGEFYDLDYEEALRRIERAREEFKSIGLSPRGFVAPAWLLGPEAERAATDAGIEYTARIGSVRDLHSQTDSFARSLVYSTRKPWRRKTSLAWNSALFLAATRQPLVRLSIHPTDYTHPEVWKQILKFIDQLLKGRSPTTYAAWIDEQRVQSNRSG
jgi:uncharacterized protein